MVEKGSLIPAVMLMAATTATAFVGCGDNRGDLGFKLDQKCSQVELGSVVTTTIGLASGEIVYLGENRLTAVAPSRVEITTSFHPILNASGTMDIPGLNRYAGREYTLAIAPKGENTQLTAGTVCK